MMGDITAVEAPSGVALEESKEKEEQGLESAEEYELTVTEESLMRLHGLSVTLPLPCDLCPIGTVFDDLDEFDAHMKEHPEAKMFACQLCSNTYKSWSNLVAHRKMFHLGEVLSCERCGERKSHERLEGSVHYPVGGKPHGCEECDIGFDTVAEVYRHYLYHKAPPGTSRRRGGNNFGPSLKKKAKAAVEKGTKAPSDKADLPKIQNPNGGLVPKVWRNKSRSQIKNSSGSLISGLVVSHSNIVNGNLILHPSGNITAAVAGSPEALPGSQNGKLIGNVIMIPSAALKNLPGIKGGNLILKPVTVQDGIVKTKHTQKPLIVKSSTGVNPIISQSDVSSINTEGSSSVNFSGNSTVTQTGTESVRDVQTCSSPAVTTVALGVVSSNNHEGNLNASQSTGLPDIPSESLDEFLSQEPKNCFQKMEGFGTAEKKHSKGLRPIAPKGGFESIPDALNEQLSSSLGEPVRDDDITKEHRHFCPHCSFSCTRLQDYRSHLSSKSSSHDCNMCSSSDFKKLSSTDHEYCQAKGQRFRCIPCNLVVDSDEEFELHLNGHHTQGYLPCCLCGRKFKWLLFLDHVRSCQQKRMEWETRKKVVSATCEPCGKSFHSSGALRRHMKVHDANRKPMLDCKTCGRLFQHRGAYSKHLWANPTHGPPEQRARIPGTSTNYICEKCGKTFSKREGLKGHLMRHAGLKPHACPSCPKSFVTRTSLVIHVRQHTGERPYMCEVCGKNFTGPTSLYVHQRKHRIVEDGKGKGRPLSASPKGTGKSSSSSRFTCPVCSKTLSSKLIFEGHIRQHTGERPFVCEVCGRGFTTAKIMRLHCKRHEKEKPREKVQRIRWVHDICNMPAAKEVEDGTVGCDSNSSSACIFLCPRCGMGLVSTEELEEHLAKGDCPSEGADMFVLPMTSETECIDTASMVIVDQHGSNEIE